MTAEFIRDLSTAHLLLQHLVEKHSERPYDVQFRTWHDLGASLELGDVVLVLHPLVTGGNPALCEIMAVETDGDGVAITARTRAFGGFSETWEPPSDGVYITVFTETWES